MKRRPERALFPISPFGTGRTRAWVPCNAHIASYWLCIFFHQQSSFPRWKALTVILPQYFLELWRPSSIFCRIQPCLFAIWGNGGLRSVERDFWKGANWFVSLTSLESFQSVGPSQRVSLNYWSMRRAVKTQLSIMPPSPSFSLSSRYIKPNVKASLCKKAFKFSSIIQHPSSIMNYWGKSMFSYMAVRWAQDTSDSLGR